MMEPEWCPSDIWQSANTAVIHAPEYTQRLHEDVARALLDAHQRGRREGMEEAADMIDHGFEKPVGKPYRPDGIRSKHDQCPHGLYMYEDCEDCCSNAIRAKTQEAAKDGT